MLAIKKGRVTMAYVENLLAADESILIKQRPHWIAFLAPLAKLVVHMIILVILIQLLDISRPAWGVAALIERYIPLRSIIGEILTALPSWVAPVFLLLYFAISLLTFLKRELDLLNLIEVVTTQRVIQVRGTLSKSVADSSLEKINDVVLNQSLLGRLLGYGDLSIMTASEIGFSQINFLRNPIQFKRTMLEAKRGLAGGGRVRPSSGPTGRTNVAERLAQLENLRQQGLISPAEFEARRQKLLDQI